ncbi:MAG TPA: pseudaminic acid cytidylyltransferase [Succinivibrionaceae bacterium]|nr:pseudaminic acid cytidylyltransferase [Succinivibrionaceae bacterium]
MHTIAVIPARGGSTRIPHKNIKKFAGRPLIAYPIQAALESELFDKVVVSTDDEEIAEVARKYGAEIPFMRDKSLADNYTGTGPVVADAYKRIKDAGTPIDYVACIYATAPLLTAKYLKEGFEFFLKEKADFLYSCCEFPFPIQRAQYLDSNGSPYPVMPQCMPKRSQDLPKAYQDCGLFYFHTPRTLVADGSKTPIISRGFVMPRHRVIDIDTREDWDYAQAMFRAVNELKLD